MSAYAWKSLKRVPCSRGCGSECQRADGVCWRCAEAERAYVTPARKQYRPRKRNRREG